MDEGNGGGTEQGRREEGRLSGIVIRHARSGGEGLPAPRIAAFIWGGKVRPQPTLPFGRWKGAA